MQGIQALVQLLHFPELGMDNGAADTATVTTAGTACCAARHEKRDRTYTRPQLELPVGGPPNDSKSISCHQ